MLSNFKTFYNFNSYANQITSVRTIQVIIECGDRAINNDILLSQYLQSVARGIKKENKKNDAQNVATFCDKIIKN